MTDRELLELAVKLEIVAGRYAEYSSAACIGRAAIGDVTVWRHEGKDPYAAIRRAIVRAAVEIGEAVQ